jgi:hypothetical protein
VRNDHLGGRSRPGHPDWKSATPPPSTSPSTFVTPLATVQRSAPAFLVNAVLPMKAKA